jgi:hypothetical protein
VLELLILSDLDDKIKRDGDLNSEDTTEVGSQGTGSIASANDLGKKAEID